MKRLLSCAGALALACVAQTSFAADMRAPVAKAPASVAAPLFNWSGFYWGGYAGGEWGRFLEDGGDKGTFDGWVVGTLSGWNQQSGNWVWGFEWDSGWSRTSGGNEPDGVINRFNMDSVVNARVRLGAAQDRLLWFVAGGVSAAHYKLEHPAIGKAWATGWNVGAGVDWAASNNMIFRLEYLYADYRDKFVSFGDHGHDIDAEVHTVRVAAIWRFASGKYPIGKTPPAPVVTKN
jgi:outer membrane immunogenic protein